MVLNYIWIAFFVIAFIIAAVRLVFLGDTNIFNELVNATFESSKNAFELSLGLTGILALWLGLMKIAEQSGLIQSISRALNPVLSKLFPEIPKGHPVMGSMFMNMAANMLGLDNAATPLGLKAMSELQELNPRKDTASNSMIMFLVMNTSGLMLIPTAIMAYRAQMGATQPTDVFLPILLSTLTSTLVGITVVAISQRIRIWNRGLVLFLLGLSVCMAGLIYAFVTLPQVTVGTYSTLVTNILLFMIMVGFILSGLRRRINVFDAFVEGAKDGFKTAVRIIPYLVAFLVGIAVFRTSGALSYIVEGIGAFLGWFGINTDFVAALPTGLMKSLSGSGANGLMIDAMQEHGADSFVGRTASVLRGASDTTFYILAVYFGSVGITRTRNAVGCGLIADLAGVIAAICFSYIFFY